jgi:hypothetical protein
MTPDQDLKTALDALMRRLVFFSQFPKYSLERRIDIFLVPFVEALVKGTLDRGAKLVAPEFPILRDLHLRAAGSENALVAQAAAKPSRRTVNLDYLFHLPGPEWLFVELKTDVRSFDTKQAERYAEARRQGMRRLRADLDLVRTGTRQPKKYKHLLRALRELGTDGPVKIAYLAPKKLLQNRAYQRHQEQPERAIDHFFALEDLGAHAANAKAPFPVLWPVVDGLLVRVLERAEGGSREDGRHEDEPR